MAIWYPEYKSAACIKKLAKPILTKADIPYRSELVFNAGVVKFDGKYIMAFRNDHGATREEYEKKLSFISCTDVGFAISKNGVDGWEVMSEPLISFNTTKETPNLRGTPDLPYARRIYDPRLTVIEGELYMCLALDTRNGIRGLIVKVAPDLKSYEIMTATVPDNRNMVLFPEKINDCFVRLERPFPLYGRRNHRFDIWLSRSPDMRYWGDSAVVFAAYDFPLCNDKIGPAAPPVRTDKGWLTLFHFVDIAEQGRGQDEWDKWWNKRYCAGIMLLDLEDPTKIVGMSREPLIAPELSHETDHGYRTNVIFPGGMILEPDGEVKIYYGASDTVECLATANVNDLIALCDFKPYEY